MIFDILAFFLLFQTQGNTRITLHSVSVMIKRCSNILLHLKLSCFNVAMMSGFKIPSNVLDISSLEAHISQQTN